MQFVCVSILLLSLASIACGSQAGDDVHYLQNIARLNNMVSGDNREAFALLREAARRIPMGSDSGRTLKQTIGDLVDAVDNFTPSKRSLGFQVETQLRAFQASKNEQAQPTHERTVNAVVGLDAEQKRPLPSTERKRSAPATDECIDEADASTLIATRRAIAIAHDNDAETSERQKALQSLVPRVDVRWSRKDDSSLQQLIFDVSAPYVSDDARWIIDFRPLQPDHREAHRELAHPRECAMHYGAMFDLPPRRPSREQAQFLVDDDTDIDDSASFDTSEEPLGLIGEWRAAGNALQRGAFSDIVRYPASFVSQRSRWRAHAQRCSRVDYTARFHLEELMRCKDALAAVRGDRGDEQTVLGALHVTLATPTNPRLIGAVMHFSLSVDEHGNALLLRSESAMPDNHSVPLVELRGAAFAHTPAPLAHIELLTQSSAPLAISSVQLLNPAQNSRVSDIASAQKRVPQSRIDGAYQVQRWQFSGARSLYENESLQVRFERDKDATSSDVEAWRDTVTARLSASLDDKPALDRAQVDAAQTGLSQTVDGAPARVDSERMVAVRDGARVCQVVNIAVPPALAPLVEIVVTGATLCPDLLGAERSCEDSPLAFDIFSEPTTNVSVTVPGPFGATSAQVCYTARNAFFNPKGLVDASAPRQRFEARAQLAARGTAKRQDLLRWMKHAEAGASAEKSHVAHTYTDSAKLAPEHRSLDYREGLLRAARFRVSGAVRDAYAHSELADSLRVARLERKLGAHEHVADTFVVVGQNADKSEVEKAALRHNISDGSALLAIIVIAIVCACTCTIYAYVTLRGGRSIFGATSRVSDSMLHTHFRRGNRH